MADLTVGAIVALLVLMLIGATIVLPVIGQITSQATAAQNINGEAIVCANGTTTALKNDNLVSATITVYNGTTGTISTIPATNYTVTTSNGRIAWNIGLNSALYGTGCVAVYSYYDDAYLANSSSRTVAGLLPLLIAIVLVVAVVAYFKFK